MKAAFLIALLLCGQAHAGNSLDVYLHPQTLARLPDGRALHFFCLGEGSPIAILDAGWGGWSTSWRAIQPKLAERTKVCALDRAGYGFSDPGPLPRDAAAVADDLQAGLAAAGLAPPYLLVGHSQGGFEMRLFAYRHPDETAGLLLLDPPTEQLYLRDRTADEDLDQTRRCLALAKQRRLKPGAKDDCVGPPAADWSPAMRAHQIKVASAPAYFEAALSEDLSLVGSSTDEIVAARRSLGALPLIVLQADARPEEERSRELDNQARDSSIGRHVIVAGSRHYIQNDRPDVFLDAFQEILEKAR